MPLCRPPEISTGELSHLGYRRYLPDPRLRRWVQCYWSVRQNSLPAGGYVERLYPDGGSSLTFNRLLDSVLDGYVSVGHQLVSQRFCGAVDSLGIRFHPGGLARLLGVPVDGLEGTVYRGSELNLIGISELAEQLFEATGLAVRLALIEQWLLNYAEGNQPVLGPVQWVWPRLCDATDIETLLRQGGIGRRTVERSFRREVGITPAQTRTLLRVGHARALIKREPTRSLTDVGAACGFYDQAHFIRQFRRITWQTPGQYRQRQVLKRHD